ncbi:hypothetical protein BB561_000883 [Smittium simulii]|uniref:Actin-related protein 2/3 complex subunit 3 n=1 Tax=Smittium simulii TaxID=133385 RepID=A0A2T9YX25_9FUNG|nr:hypothetical protein BB561_000883 [Smittium simulii]
MPVYHSSFNGLEGETQVVSGIPFLPLKTKTRGPAPIATSSSTESQKSLYSLSVQNFILPGDKSFPLAAMYLGPPTKTEADNLRLYLLQFRQEIAMRLLPHVYAENSNSPSKWWLSFQKRHFMNKSL